MTKKKESVATATIQDVKHDLPSQTEKVDKGQEVLDALKEKSSEIVISTMFKKAKITTTDSIRDVLDSVCGIDGWSVDYKLLANGITPTSIAILGCLEVRIAGDGIFKCGVGTPDSPNDAHWKRHILEACDNAFRAAAREFGIGRTAQPETVKDVPKEESKPVAAAAKSPDKKEEKKPNASGTPTEEFKKHRIKELKEFWTAKISECLGPNDLTGMMASQELKTIPEFSKQAVWDHIQEQAKSIGWLWNKDSVQFYSESPDNEVGEAIPF